MVKESSASLIESPDYPTQPIDFNVPSYHFKRTVAGVGHGLNDIKFESAPAFSYIKDFLANNFSRFNTTPPNNYNDNPQSWRPYIMFCMASRSIHPDIGFVKNGIETRRISLLGSWWDLTTRYEICSAYDPQGELTPGWIWMYNAPPNTDYDAIRIYYTRLAYVPVNVTPGQSMIVKKLVGIPQGGTTPHVAYSSTLISAANGGEAQADPSGMYTKDSISIPAGGLQTDSLIEIGDPVEDFGLTTAVEINPSITFNIPATVKVEYKDTDIPAGYDESSMRLLVYEESGWKKVEGSSVDSIDKTVSGTITHLSIFGAGIPLELLLANFISNTKSGNAPLNVQFTDMSEGSPTSWNWTFGDDRTATCQYPSHTYNTSGIFSVGLTVLNVSGSSNSTIKIDYITVFPKGDFNTNWRVDIGDVTRVAYMAAGLITADSSADFNGYDSVDVGDACKIAWYYVGKVTEL
jgi:hypothetical protein